APAEVHVVRLDTVAVHLAQPAAARNPPIIDHSIAVVVDSVVADLRNGIAGHAGLPLSVHAIVDGARAGALPARAAAQVVVDRIVAIVVDAIAHLGRGSALDAALPHAADTVVDGPLAR